MALADDGKLITSDQDGIYVLSKAYTILSFPNVTSEIVLMLVWLMMIPSCPFKALLSTFSLK